MKDLMEVMEENPVILGLSKDEDILYAGIEGSGWIVSINSDPKAPIIKMSDASFTDDYKNIWPRMEQIL